MRKSNFYGVDVPELGDRADITVVSQAIVDGENNQSGRIEYLDATSSGTTIILSSETRTNKLLKYYNGLAVQFVSPVDIVAGNSYKIQIDNLAEQPYNNKTDIKTGDIVQAHYGASGFVSSNAPIPRSSSTSSSSEITVATSLAVKNVNDNANTRALKTTQIIAGNGLTGGGTLEANRTINVASADDSITVGADNIKVNTYNGVDSTSTTRPASANAVKNANDNANKRYLHTKYTTTVDVNTIKTSGVYSIKNIPTNAGTSTHGTLIVDFDVGTPYQIWIPDNSHAIYKRTYNTSSASWNAWSSTLTNSISGNAATATKLQTARTLTIGSTGKSVDGSANVSWSLSEIGAAASNHTHNYIASRSRVTAETGTATPAVAGLSMSECYNNGYPTSYGNIITLSGAGGGQILIGWSGTSGAVASNYIRSKRDTSGANWSAWTEICTAANFNTFCPYKVGDIFLTTNSTNPSTVWLGTTWSKIEGRMLLGTSGSGASKATGGSNTVALSTANLPSHTHTASQSAHTHSRGTQDIVGTWHNTTENQYWQEPTGAIFRTKLGGDGVTGTSGWFDKMTLQASRNWTGSTTSVQPAVTVGATGSGSAFSILSSYYTVHMWLRLT